MFNTLSSGSSARNFHHDSRYSYANTETKPIQSSVSGQRGRFQSTNSKTTESKSRFGQASSDPSRFTTKSLEKSPQKSSNLASPSVDDFDSKSITRSEKGENSNELTLMEFDPKVSIEDNLSKPLKDQMDQTNMKDIVNIIRGIDKSEDLVEAVTFIIDRSMDQNYYSSNGEKFVILKKCYEEKIISSKEIIKGFELYLEMYDDKKLDIPKLPLNISHFLFWLFREKYIDFSFLKSNSGIKSILRLDSHLHDDLWEILKNLCELYVNETAFKNPNGDEIFKTEIKKHELVLADFCLPGKLGELKENHPSLSSYFSD